MLVLLVALAVACSPAAAERTTPGPAATATPTEAAEFRETPALPTPDVAANPRIERVTIATRIASDDSPLDETTVVTEWPDLIYLCVLMSEIVEGTRLRAYWYQGSEIIGQSDMSPPASNGAQTWVALRYRPVARLNPAEEYAVELRLGGELIDRYVFRVGAGNPADAIAAIAFTSGFDEAGNPIEPRTRFQPDVSPLTLRMRISNQVDPTGMVFSSLWYRGEAQIARIAGEPAHNQQTPAADPRRINFVFTPQAPLAVGQYHVVVLLNGAAIETVRFSISTEPDEPTATPEATNTPEPTATATVTPSPSPTSQATATPRPSASVRDVALATQINNQTGQPLDGPIFSLDRPGGTNVELWLAVAVTDLTPVDEIVIVIRRDNGEYDRIALPGGDVAAGWIAVIVNLEAPAAGSASIYSLEVVLNDQGTLSTSCQITGT